MFEIFVSNTPIEWFLILAITEPTVNDDVQQKLSFSSSVSNLSNWFFNSRKAFNCFSHSLPLYSEFWEINSNTVSIESLVISSKPLFKTSLEDL